MKILLYVCCIFSEHLFLRVPLGGCFCLCCLTLSRLWRGLWAVSRVEESARARLFLQGLSCWEASVALYLRFWFWAWSVWSMIAICGRFCSAGGGVINSSSVYYGFFLYWEWSFQFCGGAYGLCLKSRAQRTRLSYPAGKLQWHFTCGFKFRHSLWLPFVAGFAALKGLLIVSVGTMGYF